MPIRVTKAEAHRIALIRQWVAKHHRDYDEAMAYPAVQRLLRMIDTKMADGSLARAQTNMQLSFRNIEWLLDLIDREGVAPR